jgi:HlyD family secretion protein
MYRIKILLWLFLVGAGGGAVFLYAHTYWKVRNGTEYEVIALSKGTVVQTVNSTGTVHPVRRVKVGSMVSGPVEQIFVDYNSVVKKGDLMARIDSRIYKAAMSRDTAACASARAEVERVKAQVSQARNDEERAIRLRQAKKDFLSDAEMDRVRFFRISCEAQLAVAQAQVQSAESLLKNSEANLTYTEIRAPEDGIVVERKVDVGESLAAQFQTPELFVVAPEIEKHVDVFASVDEADIGLIRGAQQEKRPVSFTVDAYPEVIFAGAISQVHINPKITSSVVTYDVVIEAPNPQMQLLPGMTANITFQIAVHDNVLRVPNAALRFFPQAEQVRREDRVLLEGGYDGSPAENRDPPQEKDKRGDLPAAPGAKGRLRHLWVVDGEWLRAVPVVAGITDKTFTEIVGGDVTDKELVVSGVRAP